MFPIMLQKMVLAVYLIVKGYSTSHRLKLKSWHQKYPGSIIETCWWCREIGLPGSIDDKGSFFLLLCDLLFCGYPRAFFVDVPVFNCTHQSPEKIYTLDGAFFCFYLGSRRGELSAEYSFVFVCKSCTSFFYFHRLLFHGLYAARVYECSIPDSV